MSDNRRSQNDAGQLVEEAAGRVRLSMACINAIADFTTDAEDLTLTGCGRIIHLTGLLYTIAWKGT